MKYHLKKPHWQRGDTNRSNMRRGEAGSSPHHVRNEFLQIVFLDLILLIYQ